MFSRSCRTSSARHGFSAMRPSGNTAFDAYKEDTLRRLEDEQSSFEDFLQRLRDAKDKAEFDEFMDKIEKASWRWSPSNHVGRARRNRGEKEKASSTTFSATPASSGQALSRRKEKEAIRLQIAVTMGLPWHTSFLSRLPRFSEA